MKTSIKAGKHKTFEEESQLWSSAKSNNHRSYHETQPFFQSKAPKCTLKPAITFQKQLKNKWVFYTENQRGWQGWLSFLTFMISAPFLQILTIPAEFITFCGDLTLGPLKFWLIRYLRQIPQQLLSADIAKRRELIELKSLVWYLKQQFNWHCIALYLRKGDIILFGFFLLRDVKLSTELCMTARDVVLCLIIYWLRGWQPATPVYWIWPQIGSQPLPLPALAFSPRFPQGPPENM